MSDNTNLQAREMRLAEIHPGPNDRKQFDQEAIRLLAADIEQNGLISPITIRPHAGGYEIVCGERRYHAFQHLGRATIPAFVIDLSDREARRRMLAENLQRKNLTPIEEAQAFAARLELDQLSVYALSQEMNIPESRIESRLALLKLNADIQQLVATRQLDPRLAELMAPLDANFQAQAMRYFNSGKRPDLREFRGICSVLREKQSQAVGDWASEFMTQVTERQASGPAEVGRVDWDRIPRDAALPDVQSADNVSAAIEVYIATLLGDSDPYRRDIAAGIIGQLYIGLLKTGLLRRPLQSPIMVFLASVVELASVAA